MPVGAGGILADALGVPLDEPYPLLQEWQAPDCVLGVAPAGYPPQYRRWRRIRATEPDIALPGGKPHRICPASRQRGPTGRGQAASTERPVLAVAHILLIGAIRRRDPLYAAAHWQWRHTAAPRNGL